MVSVPRLPTTVVLIQRLATVLRQVISQVCRFQHLQLMDAPGQAQVLVEIDILGDVVVVLEDRNFIISLTRMDRRGRIIREG